MHPIRKHLSTLPVVLLLCLSLLCVTLITLAQTMSVRAAPLAVADPIATIFINEIHYDNVGTDTGEFVEVVAPAGTDLTGWSLVPYNGSNGDNYSPVSALSGIVADTACGYGFFVVNYASNGLQNGNDTSTQADGIALVNSANVVVQFLSYEGVLTADMGVANGLTSTSIRVLEATNTPVGQSLQLTGNGSAYGNFTWSGPNAATSGAANVGQTFGTCDPAPSVSSVVPAANSSDIALNANISINFSEAVDVTEPWFAIQCTVSGAHSAGVSGGPQSFTLDPTVDFANSESCTVTLTGAQIVDQDGAPQTLGSDYSWTFNTVANLCAVNTETKIHAVQGSGLGSTMVGATVAVKGVVVGDYQGSSGLSGFYLQEEDGEVDGDASTSEGIFVFNNTPVNLGDVVRVQGVVTEFDTSGTALTELTSVSQVQICATGASVTPATVGLPVTTLADWEKFEGMVITIPALNELTVTENFTLGRFGEVHLSGHERLYQPTQLAMPGADALAVQQANDLNRILLDDGRSTQNPDPVVYPSPYLSATNTLRGGDKVVGDLTGILDHRFGYYRIQPLGTVNFANSNPRPADPPQVDGTVKVAAANVLNYFTTIDWITSTVPILCGPPSNRDECRGANTNDEFIRQRTKIINGLAEINADVVGLLEIENNEYEAVADLVSGLNQVMGSGTYTYIDTGFVGTDMIKVAIIYKPGTVTPVGDYAILDSSVDPAFIDTRNRPALAQTFQENATTERFTVAVNHLKSKGSACADIGDPDALDGQGNCNGVRTAAATALVGWLAGDPTGSGDPDFLIIGDLNSYAKEDPIQVITGAGYVDEINRFLGAEGYSYAFGGQVGYLDHALASSTLDSQVTGAAEWHVNADEPVALDYNLDFQSAAQKVYLYSTEPYRFSDHDPLIVGLDLASDTPTSITIVKDARPNNLRNFRFGGTLGNFRLDDPGFNDFDNVSDSKTFEVAGGGYTIFEEVPDSWHLTNIQCSGGSTTVDLANHKVTINIIAGQSVTCTFINEYGSTIWVDKYSDLDANGRRSWELGLPGWKMSLYNSGGTLVASDTTNIFGKVHFRDVAPGQYTLCETQRNGWSNSAPGTIDPTYQQPCYTLAVGPAQRWLVEFGNYRTGRAAALNLTAPDAASLDAPTASALEIEDVDDESYEEDGSFVDPDLHRPAQGQPGPLFMPQITR